MKESGSDQTIPRRATRVSRRLAGGAAAAAVALFSTLAGAQAGQSTTIAEALFREGQKLMQEGKLAAACDKLAASQKMDPALGTLLNLAVCHEKQGKTATAWAEFGEVISMAQRAGDTAREQYARQRYNALEKAIHRVVVEVLKPSPGTEIILDGEVLDRAAWGTGIPLDPGEHTIEVTAPGKKAWTRRINLGPSSSVDRIEVPALEDEVVEQLPASATDDEAVLGPTDRPADPEAISEPSPHQLDAERDLAGDTAAAGDVRRPIGYAVGAAGLVGLGAAGYFGLSARSHARQRDELCPPGQPCTSQPALDAHHDARVAQRWMLVTGGVGLAAVGTGIWLILSSSGSQEAASVAVSPLVATSGAGMELSGRW